MSKKEKHDRKTIEKEYIDSYHYSTRQQIIGVAIAVFFLLGIIVGGTILFISLIAYFTS